MLDHGVEDDERLAHAGCEGQLLRLASGQQPLVEVPDNGIEAGGCQGSHVEGGADPGASAPYGTFTPQRTATRRSSSKRSLRPPASGVRSHTTGKAWSEPS